MASAGVGNARYLRLRDRHALAVSIDGELYCLVVSVATDYGGHAEPCGNTDLCAAGEQVAGPSSDITRTFTASMTTPNSRRSYE